MKICYLDCASGISGDMTLGALIDAGAPLAKIQAGIDSLGLDGCRLHVHEVIKKGFRAAQLIVESPELWHTHEHAHESEHAEGEPQSHDDHTHDHDHDHDHDHNHGEHEHSHAPAT